MQIIDGMTDRPVVIGAGLAGLTAALALAPAPVVLLAAAPLGTGAASAWAQGGIAAALGPDDEPGRHAADTLACGGGLNDPAVVACVTAAAAAVIERLSGCGVAFDRDRDGRLALGLEAAHGRRRIVHAGGDATGRLVMDALIERVRRTPSITLLEGVEGRRLLVEDGAVTGVLAADRSGAVVLLPSRRVVIATGGLGGLYRDTSNPSSAIGRGLALAARAGAVLADMEFVQFHPTALAAGADPMPLVSEAVRGDGAILIDETGARFVDELAPRDVVARGVWRQLARGHRVFLDARRALGSRFPQRFPAIAAHCRAAGIDPATMPIPVRPAAHYHMGGIAVDGDGRSSVTGLWACGEAASTGLHGANRLASNSLLEAAACAGWVAASVAGTIVRAVRPKATMSLPPAADAAAVRPILAAGAGLLRHRAGLTAAIAALLPLALGRGAAADPAAVGLLIAVAALRREESRGAHCREDFPEPAPVWARRQRIGFDEAVAAARDLVETRPAQAVGA